ncbi:MAG: transketolase [Zetaproteobacteria bacterium]|nr:MAG: transketolase [Zetaproteobacteria bacterium]
MENAGLVRELEAKARKLRLASLFVMKEMGIGWLGGSFSSADVVTALLFHHMRHDPKNPQWPERDRLVTSKGHSCEIVYAALAEAGYFPREELKTYSHPGARLQTHVNTRTPGIEYSGGSLGLGLSFAVGAAAGAYIHATEANLASPTRRHAPRYRVYGVVGDGECNEGQVWEAAANGSHHRLDNLTAIVDCNRFQSTGSVEKTLNMLSLADKFRSFGWEVREIDGNNMSEVVAALDWAARVQGKPQAVVAHTVKGKGVPAYENTNCHFIKITDEIIKAGQEALQD